MSSRSSMIQVSANHLHLPHDHPPFGSNDNLKAVELPLQSHGARHIAQIKVLEIIHWDIEPNIMTTYEIGKESFGL